MSVRAPERTPEDERDPRLDGVRGIAILLVLVCHLTQYGGIGPNGPWADRTWKALTLPMGFGVDLFFVLSGFLITGILLDTRDGPGYFKTFYARRVLRIFPLYYASLAVALLLLPVLRRDAFWYWTYTINYRFADISWPRVPYLGHFWSLAVEEQFYLVWPALVRFLPRRVLPWVCVAAVALGGWGRVHAFNAGEPPRANIVTHLHLDGLAIGSLLAWLARRPGGLPRWRGLAGPVAAIGAVACVVLIARGGGDGPELASRAFQQTALALTFGAGLLLAVTAEAGSRFRAALCAPWLTRVGLYSYSLYVIHAPILVWAGRHHMGAELLPRVFGSRLPGFFLIAAGYAALCLALSALSYHQFERRFLALKRYFRYARPVPPETVERARARAV